MNFCSRTSIDAQEPCAGTGVRAQAYVFLPVPKKVWHHYEMNLHWASQAELDAVRAARQAGVVTRLYNPPSDANEDAPILVHARGDPAGDFLQPVLAMFGRRWRVDVVGRPRLAICTHGTRDRCCAKFGFAAYQAARKLYESGVSAFEPIESSHLGGDRFAATGIFFPSGSMYAHLDAVDLGALCNAEAGGQLDPQQYRGRVFDPPIAQVVRAGLARAGLVNDASAPLGLVAHGPLEMEASIGGGRYRVELKLADLEFYGSCSALAATTPSQGRRRVFVQAEQLDG
ncbi:hypothetical protein LJR219_001701 [Phenylobacterium sp. LjRoot219]|uniref:sucrase ferredoxin n=1 Tax=Phenylobacterium sp. LjRoot219 TaxID=3342283 RepID=UPI003ECE5759